MCFLSDAEKREALGWRGGGKRKFAPSRLRRKEDDWEDWEGGGDDGASGHGGGGHWQSQPRVPAGSPDGGQWTDGEAEAPAALQNAEAGTTNMDHAARMLGIDRNEFRSMIHAMKKELLLGPADNVRILPDGSIIFQLNLIGNILDYRHSRR